jgi:hypothetical protein
MKTIIPTMMKQIILPMVLLLFLSASCKKDKKETTTPVASKTEVKVKFKNTINAQEAVIGEYYKDNMNRDLRFTTLKFYASNVRLLDKDGKETVLKDISLIDFDKERYGEAASEVKAEIKAGEYKAVAFDLGVRQDLNGSDPSIFEANHPLSYNSNMYWSWATQYIFVKFEGWVKDGSNDVSWFIHTGTSVLYRPNVVIEKAIKVEAGKENTVFITLNFDKAFSLPNALDLVEDGKSHTEDNFELAKNFSDNLKVAFE